MDTPETLAAALGVPLPPSGRADAVGFVGPDVPIEVLLASGRPFGHLPWRSDDATPWADRWLESSFPYWARSILEQWHAGAFDGVETVVFSRADDASQRLYYYVAELQRRGLLGGPEPHVLDLALQPRDSSAAHTADAVRALCRALDVAPAVLPEGIARANGLRRRLAELERGRVSDGAFYERLARLAVWTDPTQWLPVLAVPAQRACGARVALAGSVPPDDRLHRAVEATGASVIGDAHVHALTRLGPALVPDAGPLERQIAVQLRRTSIGPRAPIDRARWLVERAAAVRADAVIVWLTREDEALAWHVPAERDALAAAGIPALMLTAARWQADDDTLERIAAFCTEILHATA